MHDTTQTGAAPDCDHAVLESTLEIVVARVEDVGPEVYSRFFSRCPARADLFRVVDPALPPHGCGQMLFEIISLIRDTATGQAYVASYMKQIAAEHAAFGVQDPSHYAEFLASLVDVLANVLGRDWTDAHAAAWARQSAALLKHLPPTPA